VTFSKATPGLPLDCLSQAEPEYHRDHPHEADFAVGRTSGSRAASVKTAMAFVGGSTHPDGPELDLEGREGPRDECGVFGLYAPGHEVSRLSYFALYALQHRGQESAGIAAADRGGHIITRRELGLVNQVFTENDLSTLAGELAIGHVRYSTTGSNAWENSQPVQRSVGTRGSQREVALAHNGNLINAVELHSELLAQGVTFSSTSDSEIIAALIATHPAEHVEDAIAEVLPRLKGAFSTVVMTKDRVVAFRDPHGLRPLAIGVLDSAEGDGDVGPRYCVSSESCAFDIIGARYLRDVEPGEVVTLGEGGLESRMVAPGQRRAFCVFEYIYFARPDSRMNDQVLQVARGRMGEILWREAPVEADVVIAVPDSGNPAARGLARASGIPQDDGFVKNRYVARTFIQPGQELRKHGLRLKFNPLPEVVAGKRLVVVDDSIVRGNTTRQIVQMLRDSGAKEVHMRISAPPIKHPCHYGIDMSTREEMIAHGRSTEEVAQELGCDSLHYLSMEGVYEAVRGTRATHCDACFSGVYPLAGSDDANGKYALEED
jgi:amidophosphoribosyltransferase